MSNDMEPDAWGLLDEGEVWYATPFREEAERVIRRTEDTDSAIVALYRQPTLTDAEREAVEWCVEMAMNSATDCDNEIATLRGLLERL